MQILSLISFLVMIATIRQLPALAAGVGSIDMKSAGDPRFVILASDSCAARARLLEHLDERGKLGQRRVDRRDVARPRIEHVAVLW